MDGSLIVVAVGDIGCLGGYRAYLWFPLCTNMAGSLLFGFSISFCCREKFLRSLGGLGGVFSFFFVCPYFFGTVRFFGFLTYGGL